MGRLRHEAGQTVVLLAVLLPLLLGLGAIAVDVGYWYVMRKTAQDAADAAALAAARELPNRDQAIATGVDYVHRNMPTATAIVDTPYTVEGPVFGIPGDGGSTSDPTKVEVTVRQSAGTFFGRAFGVFGVTVTSRAVAQRLGGHGNLALFAHSADCDDPAVEVAGTEIFVNGLIHANGLFRVATGPFWAAEGTHNKPNCPSSIDGTAQSQFGEDMPPPSGTACAGQPCREPNDDVFQPWPAWFTPAQFGWRDACTESGATIVIAPGLVQVDARPLPFTGAIPSGTYCATESVTLLGTGLTGSITALAPVISVDGADHSLTPFSNDVLFFAVPNTDTNVTNDGPPDGGALECDGGEIELGGSRQRWSGVVFNPCGLTTVGVGDTSVGAPALTGVVLSERIRLTGSRLHLVGDEDFRMQPHLALVE